MMVFTRDSWTWLIGVIAAGLVAISTNLHLFPWLSPTAQHWINLAAFAIGIISGKMASSPLPHSQDVKEQQAYEARLNRPPRAEPFRRNDTGE